jgi:hypothetical protein
MIIRLIKNICSFNKHTNNNVKINNLFHKTLLMALTFHQLNVEKSEAKIGYFCN